MKKQMEEDEESDREIDLNIYDFTFLQPLAEANAIFDRPLGEIPICSEMSYLKRYMAYNRFSRFSLVEDLFYQKNQNQQKRISQELVVYAVIIETYYYLVQFFIKNLNLSNQIKDILLEKNILFEEDLQQIISKNLPKDDLI